MAGMEFASRHNPILELWLTSVERSKLGKRLKQGGHRATKVCTTVSLCHSFTQALLEMPDALEITAARGKFATPHEARIANPHGHDMGGPWIARVIQTI
jgi:hypothetical protein